MRQRQNGITAMVLMLTSGSGITLVGMRFLKASLKLILLKVIMQNYAITWRGLPEGLVAFLVVLMRCNALCASLFIVSIADNCLSSVFQIIRLTLWTL